MKMSSRNELLREADLILEDINLKIINEMESNDEPHEAYYSSKNLTNLILTSLGISLLTGPFAIIPLFLFLYIHSEYIKGYFDEKKIISMINDKNLNGDRKLKELLKSLIEDLKNNNDVENIIKLLKSLKIDYEKNQEELQNFYRSINSKWYLSKNPDDIVTDDKKNELNLIKKKIDDSYKKYTEEIKKQTFLLIRKILSSEKYSILKSIPKETTKTPSGKMWDTSKKTSYSRYSYIKRLVKQVEEYFLQQVDPISVKDLKIKMVPKSDLPNFGWSSGV